MSKLRVGQRVKFTEEFRARYHYPRGWTGIVIPSEPGTCLVCMDGQFDLSFYYFEEDLVPISDFPIVEARAMTQFWVVEE